MYEGTYEYDIMCVLWVRYHYPLCKFTVAMLKTKNMGLEVLSWIVLSV